MKTAILLILGIFVTGFAYSQTSNPKYDEVLAKKLGADDYGMKPYVLVILKTGENQVADKAVSDSLFAGHMSNIKRLVNEGKLIVAGPLGKNDHNYRGIFIFDVKTTEEAKKLVDTDPTVVANVFVPEYYPWYGSAALPEYLPSSDKIWKSSF